MLWGLQRSKKLLLSKRYTFLLWGRDSKHTWHRISLSVARVFENMPGRMIAQVAAEVRGRSMGLGLLGAKERSHCWVMFQRGKDLVRERRGTGNTCPAGGQHLKGHYGYKVSMAFGISAEISGWVGLEVHVSPDQWGPGVPGQVCSHLCKHWEVLKNLSDFMQQPVL